MTDIAVRVIDVSKRYQLGQREPYKLLRDVLARGATTPFRRIRSSLQKAREPSHQASNWIWALKDVSFEVERGEVNGIIGRNGCGKSTLLKILSRITEPTTGSAVIQGRVGSLLEVGTGFHPELTGRENVFLNGSVLGMTRKEMLRKFDEIVAFSEISRFLDTPVKHYSSGMYVRLAFAVAAHLDPEVLLVDEVLSVGDASFQKKCLGRMETLSGEGRTVLFVSHALPSVRSLCERCILLQDGRVEFSGGVDATIERYLGTQVLLDMGVESTPAARERNLVDYAQRTGNGQMRICGFWIEDPSGGQVSRLYSGRPYAFALRCHTQERERSFDGVAVTIGVRDSVGTLIFYHHNLLTGQSFDGLTGDVEFRLHIPRLPLASGHYRADLNISQDRGHTAVDVLEGAASFLVEDGDFFGTGFEYRGGPEGGAVAVDGTWECRAK